MFKFPFSETLAVVDKCLPFASLSLFVIMHPPPPAVIILFPLKLIVPTL